MISFHFATLNHFTMALAAVHYTSASYSVGALFIIVGKCRLISIILIRMEILNLGRYI